MQKRPDRDFCTPASPSADPGEAAPTNTIAAVTRGGTRSIAVLAATALAALLLAACGGSDSTDDRRTLDNGSRRWHAGRESDAGQRRQQGTGIERAARASGRPGFTAAEVETPLEVSGGGSEQFLVKGGDNSIQEFGEESDESELQEAAETVHGFFVARAKGDWEGACSYLVEVDDGSSSNSSPESTELEDKRLRLVPARPSPASSPAAEWREITTVDAGSLRTKTNRPS